MGHEAGGSGALALVPSWVPAADDSPPETALADRLLVVPDGSAPDTAVTADPLVDDLPDLDLTDDPAPSRVLHSDPHDFAGLYVRHRWSFTLHARRYLRDQRDADEVVQEAFLRLFLALPELETELQAIAYCRRTITNLCIDRYRAQARRPRLVDLDSGGVGELADVEHGDPVVQAEDAALVRTALSMLSPLHRDALVKREVEEKPLPVIAEELAIPEDSVKHLLFRARRALRKLLAGTSLAPGVDAEDGRSLVSAARAGSRGGLAALVLLVLLGLGSGPNLESVPVVGVDLPDVIGVTKLAESVGSAVSQVGGAVSGAVDKVTPGRDAPAAPGRTAPAGSEPDGSRAVPGGGAGPAGITGTTPGTAGTRPGSSGPGIPSVPSTAGAPGSTVQGGQVLPAPTRRPARHRSRCRCARAGDTGAARDAGGRWDDGRTGSGRRRRAGTGAAAGAWRCGFRSGNAARHGRIARPAVRPVRRLRAVARRAGRPARCGQRPTPGGRGAVRLRTGRLRTGGLGTDGLRTDGFRTGRRWTGRIRAGRARTGAGGHAREGEAGAGRDEAGAGGAQAGPGRAQAGAGGPRPQAEKKQAQAEKKQAQAERKAAQATSRPRSHRLQRRTGCRRPRTGGRSRRLSPSPAPAPAAWRRPATHPRPGSLAASARRPRSRGSRSCDRFAPRCAAAVRARSGPSRAAPHVVVPAQRR
jgi:RNA polymerase sigma-70 factor (ECF subfamily)